MNLNSEGQYVVTPNTASEGNIGKTYQNMAIVPWINELQLISFFGRLNYSLKDTYLLTFTLRDDASSRFSKDNRWGLFPSVALAWKINNMSFFEGARDVMNEFKLRMGWGVTGQQDLGDLYFPYLAIYNLATQPSYYPWVNENGEVEYRPTLYPGAYNEDLKWEETTTWNVGVDMAFLNNRITASLDWYLRNTEDLLSTVTIPPGSATSNEMSRNIGSMRNIGVEFAIEARPVVTRDFTWTIGYNVAWNKNEITELNNSDDPNAVVEVGGISGGTGNRVQVHKVGYPAYSYYMYEQVYDANGLPIEGEYVDQDGDGVITPNDRVVRYQKDPKVTMTMNNTFNWKNWDFGFVLRAQRAFPAQRAKPHLSEQQPFEYGCERLLFRRKHGCRPLSQRLLPAQRQLPALRQHHSRLHLGQLAEEPVAPASLRSRSEPEVFGGIDNNVYPRPTTYSIGLVATF